MNITNRTNFTPVAMTDSAISKFGTQDSMISTDVVDFKNENKSLYKRVVRDAKVFDDGFNMLHNTLSKLHTKPVEPKFYITYGFDIPVEVGGGFVDNIEYQVLNWSGIGDVENVFNNQANVIPRVNAGMTQKTARVLTYEVAYDLKYIEMEKMAKLGTLTKSITDIYNNIITTGFDLWVQKLCYTGIAEAGIEGLFNSSKVHVHNIPACQAGTDDSLDKYTDEEIIALFNGIISKTLSLTSFNVTIVPDTLLIPLRDFTTLSNRTSDISFGMNLYNFIINNNMANDLTEMEGFKLKIKARPQLDTLGDNQTGRIVAYRKDPEFVRLDMTQPLKTYLSLPNIERACETTIFAGQVSEIQLPYNESADEVGMVQYWDFGARE